MSELRVSGGDRICRYLAVPASNIHKPQFVAHLESLGIKLPSTLPLEEIVGRGWIRPRYRIPIPSEALLAWINFPVNPREGADRCPEEHSWGLGVWGAATSLWPDRDRPVEKLWQHWLDDPDNDLGQVARANAIDPSVASATPPVLRHPRHQKDVRPWVDFFADWQVYHLAELLERARFTAFIGTGHGDHCAAQCRWHADHFEQSALDLNRWWEERSSVHGWISSYRTILANCMDRESFRHDARLGARAWAQQHGLDAEKIRLGLRDTLLTLWSRWHDRPPLGSSRLLLRLQEDIQFATEMLEDLTDKPVDPFDEFWFSNDRERRQWAQLIDALPYEEWVARRDFPCRTAHYQKEFPETLRHGKGQLALLLAQHWPSCAPLRRFCLAWMRLHGELSGRHRDLPAAATIKTNERIEQFNLIALHTERVLRFVDDHMHTGRSKQPRSNDVVVAAILRSVAVVAPSAVVSEQWVKDEVRERTALHAVPPASDAICTPSSVGTGDSNADSVIAAHLNALIARNYAAHHDYLDDALIYPNRDGTKPHAGALLLSSCLLVVIAALLSLPPDGTAKP
ncbi:MAG: hypothetical protein JNN27_07660 [Planctomycetes bacterium]|nr:hypothetical protein [Planctomycetota bacterium]